MGAAPPCPLGYGNRRRFSIAGTIVIGSVCRGDAGEQSALMAFDAASSTAAGPRRHVCKKACKFSNGEARAGLA